MPRVSVILTTCDRPEWLAEALDSVRAQTYRDTEIIVSDDASDERTAAVVAAAQRADPRVHHRRNERRLGQRPTFLGGLGAATGELFAVCHDDDAWEPEFLERTTAVMDAHPEVVACFADHWVMGDDGAVDRVLTEQNTARWKRDTLAAGLHRPFWRLAVVDQSMPAVMAAVLRRSAVGLDQFPAPVEEYYDLWLSYLVSRTGAAAWYVPERLTRYRVHGTSVTAKGGLNSSRESVYVHEQLVQDDALAEIEPELQAKLADVLTTLGIRLLRHGDRREAHRVLHRALGLRPSGRTAAGWAISLLPARVARAVAGR